MATQTKCHVRPARFGGYEAIYFWKGDVHRKYFNSSVELAARMAIDRVDDELIEAVLDLFDAIEPDSKAEEKPAVWDYFAAVVWMGAIAAPWVVLVIGVRWLLGGWQ
jgi:hypothetical protein